MKRLMLAVIVTFMSFSMIGCYTLSALSAKAEGKGAPTTSNSWQWLGVATTSWLEVGMPIGLVRTRFPFPTKVNTTVVAGKTLKQYIFGSYTTYSSPVFLYFENDVLVGWQD